MTITRRMDRQGLVTTEISGHITMTEILNAVMELGELTAYSNQLWEIVILDGAVSIDRHVTTTMEIAHNAKEVIQFKSRGAVAIVAPNARTLGWSNKVASLLRGDAIPVTVFEDESQARKWLAIHMQRAQIEATTIRRYRHHNPTWSSFNHGP